jgi:hypothetical protein
MFDPVTAMSVLAEERPIFHSEADFQHALAWALHRQYPSGSVRLEYKPFPGERFYLDMWVRVGDEACAFELKYPTRGIDVSVASERFVLKDQAAQDITRYDFVKDLVRLERVVETGLATSAVAILLTNDSAYWKESLRPSSVDAAFRIAEGRTLTGTLTWASHAGLGTMRGRETPLDLIGSHLIRWTDYSAFPGSYGTFRYVSLVIQRLSTGDEMPSGPTA